MRGTRVGKWMGSFARVAASVVVSLLLVPGPDLHAAVAGAVEPAAAHHNLLPLGALERLKGAVERERSAAAREFGAQPGAALAAAGAGVHAMPAGAAAGVPPPVAVTLTGSALPATAQAGTGYIYITGSGYPSGTIPAANVSISFAASCGGAATLTVAPNTFQIVTGTTGRAQVLLSSTLAAGLYYLSVSGSTTGGTTFASSNCSTVTVTVPNTVGPAITLNPTSLTVNAGQSASFTAAASGTPTPTVQWQSSVDGGATFQNVAGATATTLNLTTVAGQNGTKYRAVFTNSAGSATTTAATLTVDFAPTITANPLSQSISAGSTISFAATANGNPTPTVQWQVSADGGATFNNVAGATSGTLSFAAAAGQNGNEYRAVFTNSVGSATTTAATLTVTAGPVITQNPTSLTVNAGQSASFTAAASGTPTPTVQWQSSVDGGATFQNVTGATASTLNLTTVAGQNGTKYRAVFTNSAGSATTTAATLTVDFAPTITANPLSQSISAGSTISFTATANGNPTPTVQWQVSADGGATFNNVAGATSGTLSFAAAAGQNGNEYRAVFTNSVGSATTTAATLTVTAGPVITQNPASLTVNAGQSASFTAAASGTPTPTVQWQSSVDGGATFQNVSGATASTLNLTTVAGQNGTKYRAVFTNSAGSATTTAATLTVDFAPTITANPQSLSSTAGSAISFTATANGNPTPTVQWQVSADGGATFNNVAGANATTLSFAAAAGQNGNEYRAVFTNSVGSATTTAATLTVTAGPVITQNPANLTVNAGQSASFTAAASGTPTPTVQWQSSVDGGATFQNVAGATATTLSFATVAGQNGNQFRAVFTNVTGSATTTAATLTVDFAPTVTTNPAAQSTTAGSTISFTAAANGNPTPTVQWQVSADGGVTFNNVAGATAATLSFAAAVAQSGNEYRAVFTNSVGSATTTAATLTVAAGAASKLVFTTQPVNGTAGTALGAVVVTVEDAGGNVVTGSNASITISSTPAGVGGTTTVAAAAGVATFSNLLFTTDGSYTLTAVASGLTSANSSSFTIGSGAAAKLVFTTQPVTGTSGTALNSVVVQVQDTNGNLITNSTASITISSTPAGVGGTTTVAATAGVATFSNLLFTTDGSYTLTAASSGLTSANSGSFTIGSGAASKLVFTTQPTNGTSGTALNSVVVQVQDTNGNLITNSTASITISSTPAGVGGTTTVAATAGIATFTNLVFTTDGIYTLTAASSGLTSTNSSSITIGSGAASKLVFTTQPVNGSAGTALAAVVVRVEDAGGNVVTTSNASITISSTPAGVGGTTTVAATAGVATFTNLLFSATGNYTLTAAASGLTSANSSSFTIGSGAASKLVFTTQPVNGTSGTGLNSVVVQVQDTNGNLITNSNASITISSTPAGVGGTTTVAAASGVATFTNLVFTADGIYTLTAASSGLTSANSSSFTIGSGAASKLVFTTQPTNGTSGTALNSVVVQVQDTNGNVITNSTASITLSSTPAGVGGTTTIAATAGVATFTNLVFTTDGSYTLTAASSGLTSANSGSFTIGSGAASKLVFTTQPTNGTSGTALNSVVVQVQDTNGNLITNSTASITISSTPAGVGGTTTIAAASGVATFTNLLFTTDGSYTLTAAASGLTSASSNSFTIGAGAASKLVFTGQPTTGTSGTAIGSVTVQVQDAGGNPVTGSTASITISSTPAGIGGTTTVAAIAGVATFTNLVFASAGSFTLTAASTGLTSANSNSITISSGGGTPALLTVNPGAGLQGQAVTVTITAQNTHFVQGMTKANFGPGVAVGGGAASSYGPVTVTSATTATAQLTIAGNAVFGPRTVAVSTGSEQATLVNGFAVNGSPTILFVTPNYGKPGAAVTVTISGQFTHFVQGTSTANFGAGISVGGGAAGAAGPITVTNATTATAVLSISSGAALGVRAPITVTTGTETASWTSPGFFVLSNVTGSAPVVSITSPTEGAEITTLTTVTGTVVSPNLAYWTLSYQGSGSTQFTQFATGTTGTVSATFDPTMLLNGMAQIQLSATDQSGQSSSAIVDVVVTRNLKLGNLTLRFNDLSVPAPGLDINVVRTYDSRLKASSDFGYGWSLDVQTAKIEVNAQLGINWVGTLSGLTYCIVPGQAYVVTIRLPDGTEYQFQPQLTAGTSCVFGQPPAAVDMVFVPIGATPANATLTQAADTQLYVSGNFPGSVQLLDASDQTFVFDPDQYTLTLPTGQQFQLSRTFGVQSIKDTNGNTLTISSTGIAASNGRNVTFTRDAQNRITTTIDPMGNRLSYTYSASGDLATVTDQLGNISTFSYDNNHYLLSYKDPSGNQPVRTVYDDSGHLIQIINGSGAVTNINYNNAASTSSVTDFLGNTTTYVYDADGNVLSVTDPLGHVTTNTYDANDNLLTTTDPLNRTVKYTYDSNKNVLTTTDPLGNVRTKTYNAMNQLLTDTDPLGHATSYVYDASGSPLTVTDPLGKATARSFTASGQVASLTDPTGNATTFQYDASGNLSARTDAQGTVTSYTYDANGDKLSQSVTRTTSSGPQTLVTSYQYDAIGRLVQTTNPDGTIEKLSYTVVGQVASKTDALGHTTVYEYDSQNRVIAVTNADGTQTTYGYDANGNQTETTDPGGATVTVTYDPLGRVISTTNSMTGGTVTSTYDAAGQEITITDALGNTTQYAYDNSGRRTSMKNALGQITSMIYDGAGNQTSITDANGHVTTRQFDADNRLVKVVFADGTAVTQAYDATGRAISRTDEAGNTTQYAYDTLGRLASVTDALGHTTTYAYNQVNNLISQTDANGHATLFSYDQLGRRTARTLPGGQTESYSYDAASNLVSRTDFNGRTTSYAYDSLNRLLSKTPDPAFHATPVSYTYTAFGKRASMTDGTGVTTYQYDSSERLSQVTRPNGSISYTYDLQSNLLSESYAGTTVTYGYDPLNRLATVHEPNTGGTTYTYDPVGNLTGMSYPNGISHAFSYNTKNQLTALGVNKGASAVGGYTYTLDATGRRLTASELSGRLVKYVYDNAHRLTSETVSGAPSGPNGAVSYTYDPVANRTQTTSTLAGVNAGTFTFDANDRLSTNTYDANGNTLASGGVNDSYDFENRLVQHGSVTIVYDGDGNRVSKTVGGVTTKFLVDDMSPSGIQQVVEETGSDGSSRVLVYGLMRVSQRQFVPASSSTLTNYYVYDGHGSVRSLTDSSGATTDSYDFDAFGNLIHSSGTTPNEFLFAGEQFDSDLGLYYNRARYLNPATGRFLTMDPYEGDPQSPATLHKYLYTGADPVNRIDPSGNDSLMEVLTSIAIQAVLGNIIAVTLQSSFGTGALAYILSKLLPPNFVNDILAASPDAALVGTNASVTAARVIGGSIGGGIELALSLKNGNSAVYGYWGFAFFAGSASLGVAANGYAGILYAAANASDYAGVAVTVGIPSTALPAKVGMKIKQDVARLLTWGNFNLPAAYALDFRKVIYRAFSLGKNLAARGALNIGVSWGSPNATSITFSLAVSSSAGTQTSVAVGRAFYWLLTGDIPFR